MLSVYSKNKFSYLHIFFYLFILEVCVGGSGGLIKMGAITLRKIDFAIALGLSIFIFFYRKLVAREIINITVIFFLLSLVSLCIGILNYGADERVFENFLMQAFFFVLPFYAYFINSKKEILVIIKILRIAATLLGGIYLIILLLILLNIIPFLDFYNFLSQNDDIMGRGTFSFWYKGFLYMCTGIYFWSLYDKKFWKIFVQLLLLVAMFFTFTRGFFIALFMTSIIFNIFFGNFIKSLIIILISLITVIYLSTFYVSISFNRDESDYIRITQLQQVKDRIDPGSFIIGHGFGEGVPIRDNHMEINYLEIFHKQGIIGLAFWLSLFVYIIINYINIRRLYPHNEKYARPFLLSTFFVYFQSLTNPFLTNSIGMNLIMLTIVCFTVLKRNDNESIGSISGI